jgi:hypothetical protein
MSYVTSAYMESYTCDLISRVLSHPPNKLDGERDRKVVASKDLACARVKVS